MKGATVLRRSGMPDMLVPSEGVEQRSLFVWAKGMSRTIPELGLMYAVPNGGSRRPAEASIMKAEGVKAGVPDVHLPVKRDHTTLYIELKRKAFALPDTGAAKWGTVSQDQLWWLESLRAQDHWAVICRGAEHAKRTIAAYLEGDQDMLEDLDRWWVDMDSDKLRKVTKKAKTTVRKRNG